MSHFYSNITLRGVGSENVLACLKEHGDIAYVSPAMKDAVVVFHEDLAGQEELAARLSLRLGCPALLAMVYGQSILLYQLYQSGRQIDAYVSSPHDDLELEHPAPPGDAAILCAAFQAERFERRVETILRKVTKPDQPYAYAINRHGELARALGLPLIAAGAGFEAIEMGELPQAPGFDSRLLIRTK